MVTWVYSARIKHDYVICLPSVTDLEEWLQRSLLHLSEGSRTLAAYSEERQALVTRVSLKRKLLFGKENKRMLLLTIPPPIFELLPCI